MEMIKVKAVVIAETKFGENDKLLTLFTDTLGAINVSAKGATSRHNNLKSATRFFCYGDFVLYDKKNGYYTISEVSPITDFMGLSKDVDRLCVASELVKFIKFSSVENEESKQMQRLLLNSLHFRANTDKNINLVRCIFYIKALFYMGIPPVMEECAICGGIEDLYCFAPEEGGAICSLCRDSVGYKIPMEKAVREFIAFVLNYPEENSFGIVAENALYEQIVQTLKIFLKTHLSYDI